jgi:hypothetical protein
MQIPEEHAWLFWDADLEGIDLQRDAVYVLRRVLERGRMADVRWVYGYYGPARIRGFFEAGPHAELSPKTLALWRAFFGVPEGIWPSPPNFRSSSSAPWIR